MKEIIKVLLRDLALVHSDSNCPILMIVSIFFSIVLWVTIGFFITVCAIIVLGRSLMMHLRVTIVKSFNLSLLILLVPILVLIVIVVLVLIFIFVVTLSDNVVIQVLLLTPNSVRNDAVFVLHIFISVLLLIIVLFFLFLSLIFIVLVIDVRLAPLMLKIHAGLRALNMMKLKIISRGV